MDNLTAEKLMAVDGGEFGANNRYRVTRPSGSGYDVFQYHEGPLGVNLEFIGIETPDGRLLGGTRAHDSTVCTLRNIVSKAGLTV